MTKALFNDRARLLRKTNTEAENCLWDFIRDRRFNRYKFIRQHIIEPYIVDFICRQKKLIIELDGKQHLDAIFYDEERTIYLESLGYKVLRFWNHEVLNNISNVLKKILIELETRDYLFLPNSGSEHSEGMN